MIGVCVAKKISIRLHHALAARGKTRGGGHHNARTCRAAFEPSPWRTTLFDCGSVRTLFVLVILKNNIFGQGVLNHMSNW